MRVPPSGTNELWQRMREENNERIRKAEEEVKAQLKAEGRSVSPGAFSLAVIDRLNFEIEQMQMAWCRMKEVLDPNTLAELIKQKEEQAEMRVPPSGTNELWQRWQRVEAENNERRRKAGDELRAQLKAEGRSVSYRIFEYAVTSRLGSEVEQVEQMRMAWNRMKEEKNEKEAA